MSGCSRYSSLQVPFLSMTSKTDSKNVHENHSKVQTKKCFIDRSTRNCRVTLGFEASLTLDDFHHFINFDSITCKSVVRYEPYFFSVRFCCPEWPEYIVNLKVLLEFEFFLPYFYVVFKKGI